MKRLKIVFALVLACVMSPQVNAEAQPLSEAQTNAVRRGCQSALRSMAIVQENEAASRVNRGRAYESTMRLITTLNSRLALNKVDAPAMTSAAAALQKSFDSFHKNYLIYANKMDQTRAINCRTAPISFYDSLVGVREARSVVAADIRTINSLLDQYQSGLDKLKTDVNKTPMEVIN